MSEYAQSVIQDSKGPLKPDNLFKFLMNDVLDKQCKEPSTIIRKYSNDTEGVRKQLSEVRNEVQKRMLYMKRQKELDMRFIKTIEKLDKAIEEEDAKSVHSNKKQRILNEYFPGTNTNNGSHKINQCSNQDTEEYVKDKQSMSFGKGAKSNGKGAKSSRKGVKSNGKRKPNPRKENKEYVQLGSEMNKLLILSLSQSTTETSGQIQPMTEIDLESQDRNDETVPVGNSERWSRSHPEIMSIDDSDESSQPESNTSNALVLVNEDDSSKYNAKESTVPERCFHLRGRQDRFAKRFPRIKRM